MNSNAAAHGYDTLPWSRDLPAELLVRELVIAVSGVTVKWHLKQPGLSHQKPGRCNVAPDEREIAVRPNVPFPKIQCLTAKSLPPRTDGVRFSFRLPETQHAASKAQ